MVALARSCLCALSDAPNNEPIGYASGLQRRLCSCSSSSGSRYCLLLGRHCSGGNQSLRIPWRGFLAQRCWFISCTLLFVLLLPGRPASCFKIDSAASFASKAPPVKDVLASSPTESESECRYVLLPSRTALEFPRENICPCRQVLSTVQGNLVPAARYQYVALFTCWCMRLLQFACDRAAARELK